MNGEGMLQRALRAVNRYVVFFLLMAFVITCCMMLFITLMIRTTGIKLTPDNLELAAKLTFGNVVFLTLICTAIDGMRRKIMVDRPVKKIITAAQKVMEGDFSVRIQPLKGGESVECFNQIIDCFNHMTEELSGTETLRTDFVANVSHELKTPLAVMQNYSTMLLRPGLSEGERIEYAKAITEASRRLADLISNILKLNKLENQQIFPAAERYDLGEQLCQCLLGFENAWEAKEMLLETELEEGVLVCSDPEMMALVWNNLFSNAIKFSEPGGTLGLKMYTEGDDAVVCISDTGCGISREVGARMFDKFYQGDTSHAVQGNGLGLALVKRVVDITHSEISVESEVGKGTAFTVRMRRNDNGTA